MKRCPACQLDFIDSVNFCRTCGGVLITVTESREKLIYCPYCGTPAKATWRFCKRCGREIEEITVDSGTGEEPDMEGGLASHPRPVPISVPRAGNHEMAEFRRCPQCQATARSEARFCDVCGTPLGATVPQPPIRPTAKILERGAVQTEKFMASPTGPASLKLGGYAEAIVPETTDLKTELTPLKRMLMGAVVVSILVAGLFLIHFWLSRTGASQAVPILTGHEDTSSAAGEPLRPFPVSFSVVAIEREDQFAGGHPHAVVKLDDQALFMIRDEANYPSTIERARAVCDNLRQAMKNLSRAPKSEFRLEPRPSGPTLVQVTPNLSGEQRLLIVTVLKQDVVGYNRRSHTLVTAEQVAQWWLNRLVDRVNLFVKGQRPTVTVEDEDGRILAELYDRAKSRSAGASWTTDVLYETLRELSPEQRRLLSYEGARVMPQHD